MPLAVAKRYAQALGEVLTKPGAPYAPYPPEAVREQLEQFHELVESQPELKNVLLSPAVSLEKKHAIIEALARQLDFPQPLRNLLFVVIDHRRLNILGEMVEALREWLDDHLGMARIEVISALPVPEEQRQEIVATFGKITGREVRARFREDAAILGGVVVKYGSRLYDGSLKAQLQALDSAIAQHA